MNPVPVAEDPVTAAKQCLDAGRIDEGEALLARVLAASPRHLAGRCVAGYAAYLRGDFSTAREHLDVAVEVDPLAFDAQYLRAFTLADLGLDADASRALGRVLALNPGCAPARHQRARLLLGLGEADAARHCLEAGRAHGFSEADIAAVLESAPANDADANAHGAGCGTHAVDPARGPVAETFVSSPASAAVGGASVARHSANLAWVDPRELLHPRRLDVAVKFLYARALLGEPGVNSDARCRPRG